MQAGKLRKRITIQQSVITRDEYGAEIKTWTTFISGWGSVEPLRGREYLEARQLQADIDMRIRMRVQKNKRPLPGMRVIYDERTLEIISVIEVNEAGRELQLMCREQIEG